jgi:chromosome segregation ATPase
MLQELGTRLSKVIEQKRLKQKLERDLFNVATDLQDKSTRLVSLGIQLEKEQVDVDKLERISLTALFYSVLGSREEQLEKERQELLSAQLRYQQAKRQVEYLQQEQNSLLQRLDELAGIEAEYELLLSEKEHLLRESNQPAASELLAFSEQIAHLNSEIKEITEAIGAGNDVIVGLEQVIESLKSAENWGTWDIFGGGLLSTAVKHSRIDDARNEIGDVQIKMSQFKRELADVEKNIELQIDIGGLESFADFFFDGLIIDWIVQSKIVQSLERSETARDVIIKSVKELEDLKKITQDKIRDIEEKRALLIEHT